MIEDVKTILLNIISNSHYNPNDYKVIEPYYLALPRDSQEVITKLTQYAVDNKDNNLAKLLGIDLDNPNTTGEDE